jgi:hypothetical protein
VTRKRIPPDAKTDPNFDPKRGGYPSGNKGRRHPTLIHRGYFQTRKPQRR